MSSFDGMMTAHLNGNTACHVMTMFTRAARTAVQMGVRSHEVGGAGQPAVLTDLDAGIRGLAT